MRYFRPAPLRLPNEASNHILAAFISNSCDLWGCDNLRFETFQYIFPNTIFLHRNWIWTIILTAIIIEQWPIFTFCAFFLYHYYQYYLCVFKVQFFVGLEGARWSAGDVASGENLLLGVWRAKGVLLRRWYLGGWVLITFLSVCGIQSAGESSNPLESRVTFFSASKCLSWVCFVSHAKHGQCWDFHKGKAWFF